MLCIQAAGRRRESREGERESERERERERELVSFHWSRSTHVCVGNARSLPGYHARDPRSSLDLWFGNTNRQRERGVESTA